MKVIIKYSDGDIFVIDAMVVRFYGNNAADIETVNGISWSITATNIGELRQQVMVGREPLVFVNATSIEKRIDW